jgi:hypothetical protein
MQFLKAKERVRLRVAKVRASGSTDERSVTIEFAMALDADTVRHLPKNIQDEYRGMKSPGTGVEGVNFESTIDSQNVRFWRLPKERGGEEFEAENVDLKSLRLERADTKDVFLFFKMKCGMTKRAWDWLWYAFTREVFAEFEECQTELDIKEAPGPAN